MAFYFNRTRHNAIVTVQISSVLDKEKALMVGAVSAMKVIPAEIGINDLVVGPGETLEILEGVTASFLGVRSAT